MSCVWKLTWESEMSEEGTISDLKSSKVILQSQLEQIKIISEMKINIPEELS